MRTKNGKNKRRVSVLLTAQTVWHLERLAMEAGYGKDVGKVIDKLTRDRMILLRRNDPPWK